MMEFIKPLIDNRAEILLYAFCVVLMYLLSRLYLHLENIDRNLWIMSHDTYDFLEDIHGELVRLEVVIASEGASFNELDQLEIDELIAQETCELSRDRRGRSRGWTGKNGTVEQRTVHHNLRRILMPHLRTHPAVHPRGALEEQEVDIEARARDISRLIRVLRLKNEKEKYHESD